MATAMASLYSGIPVRNDTAMTGEITLTGLVLPIGGVKIKVLAARRAGIRRVILPRGNRKDLRDIPEDVRAQMEFIFADRIEDVLAAALPPVGEKLREEAQSAAREGEGGFRARRDEPSPAEVETREHVVSRVVARELRRRAEPAAPDIEDPAKLVAVLGREVAVVSPVDQTIELKNLDPCKANPRGESDAVVANVADLLVRPGELSDSPCPPASVPPGQPPERQSGFSVYSPSM
jgi:hypothetical protein